MLSHVKPPSLGVGVLASIVLLLSILASIWLNLVNTNVPEPYLASDLFTQRMAVLTLGVG